MAKRNPPAKWLDPAIIHLLSWLHITIQHQNINFKDTIENHLKQKCGIDYTFTQIDRKLRGLWEKFGSKGGKPSRTVLEQGHSCLVGLRDGLRSQIELACHDLEAELFPSRPPPRKPTGSSSKLESSQRGDIQASNQQQVPTKKSAPTQKPRNTQKPALSQKPALPREPALPQKPQSKNDTLHNSLPSTPINPKKRLLRITTEASQSATKKRRLNPELSPTSSPDPLSSCSYAAATIEDSQDENEQIASQNNRNGTRSLLPVRRERRSSRKLVHTVEKDTVQEKSRCICGNTDGTINWVQCNKCGVWQHCVCVGVDPTKAKTMDYLCEECSPEAHHKKHKETQPSTRSRDMYTQADGVQTDHDIISLLKEEISRLREKLEEQTTELRECEQERDETELRARILLSNQMQREKYSVNDLMEKKDREILGLRKDVQQYKALSRFTILGPIPDQVFHENTVEKIDDIFFKIGQLSCRNDPVNVPPRLDSYKTLERLIHESFGQGGSSPQVIENLGATLASMNTLAILKTLTTCFLRIWVFESDFPMITGSSSEYGTKLREVLESTGGFVQARNLDLAARHAMIKNEEFTSKVIEPKAMDLTIEFSKILEPLFSQNSGDGIAMDWDGFSTWNDKKKMWQDLKSRLLEIFELALQTKAESTLNLQDYEFVTFPPGAPYDHRLMTVETNTGGIGDDRNDGCVVKACIQPAVYVWNRVELVDGAGTSGLSSTSNNFLQNSGKRANGGLSIKAVVNIREGNSGS